MVPEPEQKPDRGSPSLRVGYVTTYDARDVRSWSGTGHFISRALREQGLAVEHVGPLREPFRVPLKVLQRALPRLTGRQFARDREPLVLRGFAEQAQRLINKQKLDIVFSPGTIPIAYLDVSQPIVFWTDATFASMLDFYPHLTRLVGRSIREGHRMEGTALRKAALSIYSSTWAAESAIRDYGADPSRVHVVPFGANLLEEPTTAEVERLVESRSGERCRILFLAAGWARKGGDQAVGVATQLNALGLPTELVVVGCRPPPKTSLPPFVSLEGFIDKGAYEGRARLAQLMGTSHFLVLPTTADATPIAFSEAAAFGLPVLTTDVGGNSTVVRQGVNGALFPLDAGTSAWCDFVLDAFSDGVAYRRMARASRGEYESRLNWRTAGERVRSLLMTVVE